MPSLIAYCTLIRPTTPSAFANATVCSRIIVQVALADQVRRKHARRVAGVDAGVLDVLHDRRRSRPFCRRQIASTSASNASSRKRSMSTGRSSDTRAARSK